VLFSHELAWKIIRTNNNLLSSLACFEPFDKNYYTMNPQTIKEKVSSISATKGIHEQEIYSKLVAFLDTAYVYSVANQEQQRVLESAKNKILSALYAKPATWLL
jgi:uncharacterized membrane protein